MSHPVSRAARRALARKHGDRKVAPTYRGFAEKNWKLVYLRHNKLHRARQLGKIWPHKEWKKLMADSAPVKVLFVCSRNQWRSPTGEAIFARVDGVSARSAGTASNARRKISVTDIRWADLILVMEDKHKSRLQAEFRQEVTYKPVHVLDIPDDYKYMDADLVELIRAKAEPLIFDQG
jgi:predicted protein tyrosine phosphatase|tara:strand:- start:261727 stop:262260 length:534 start_codon:yes stop_codon:yes gene_type:complete|eukprot:GHVR01168468.1.p1 GENE.GHVR01168468.1~~GHVR01168468.1.p1  ORF type:complete len:178 (-),score=25.51 GHVR01168468.1:563-1096(-)